MNSLLWQSFGLCYCTIINTNCCPYTVIVRILSACFLVSEQILLCVYIQPVTGLCFFSHLGSTFSVGTWPLACFCHFWPDSLLLKFCFYSQHTFVCCGKCGFSLPMPTRVVLKTLIPFMLSRFRVDRTSREGWVRVRKHERGGPVPTVCCGL